VDCSGGAVPQVRIPEAATHQVWELLQPMQRSQRLALRPFGPLTPARPIRSCLTCFHPPSPGFSSGAYPGRKHSRSRPLVDSANALTALERCPR
jgi:hypothetical protein